MFGFAIMLAVVFAFLCWARSRSWWGTRRGKGAVGALVFLFFLVWESIGSAVSGDWGNLWNLWNSCCFSSSC